MATLQAAAADPGYVVAPNSRRMTINIAQAGREIWLDLDPAQYTQKMMLAMLDQKQLYEPRLAVLLTRILQPGDGVIDVGAHIGYFSTIGAALVGPTGAVVAIEASPDNAAQVRHHAALNGLSQLTVHQAVAKDEIGMVSFFMNSDNDGGHALWDVGLHGFNVKSRAAPRQVTIPSLTVDSVADALGDRRVRLLKIDTEGAEAMVLKGASALLARSRDLVVVAELHPMGLANLGSDQHKLRGFMREAGYACFAFSTPGNLPIWMPPNSTIESKVYENLIFAREETIGSIWPVIDKI